MIRSLETFLRGGLLAGVFALGLAACGPEYDRTEITGVVKSPLGGDITRERIEVHEGMIVKAHIKVYDDDDEQMALAIQSAKPETLEVAPVVNDHDFAFIGRKQGRTHVQIVADGRVVHTIVADVIAQPAP